jgi:hypothetical protein
MVRRENLTRFVNDNESPRNEKGMLKSRRLRILVIDAFHPSILHQGEVFSTW